VVSQQEIDGVTQRPVSQQREPGPGQAGRRDVLACDADREAVVGLLSSAFAEGRLTASEHAERVRAAYAARTQPELSTLTADLPAPAHDAGGQADVIHDGVDRCLLCALLILCPPAGIAWLLAARRRSRPSRRPPFAGTLASGGSA
jgi:hypothetical protein